MMGPAVESHATGSGSVMDETTAPKAEPYLQNRELSWLAFNERVLDQGADETVPLLERLNFISIFWSNLQEFFMVRVGSLTDLSLVKKHIIDSKSGMTPAEQLDAVYERCHELYPAYERTYESLRSLLQEADVSHLRPDDLDDEQRAFLRNYVDANVLPFLSPQIINARHPFPHLENGALYLVVRLDEEADAAGGADASAGAGRRRQEQGQGLEGRQGRARRQGRQGQGQGRKGGHQAGQDREEPRGGRRDAGTGPPAPPMRARHRAAGPRPAVHPAGARHRDGGARDILHVHRQAHQRHLRHAQRRPGCHRRLRRGRRGLPRAHEAHPEEALAPGPGAAGKRAQAVQHGRAAADEAAEPQGAPDVRDLGAARHELHLRAGGPPARKEARSPW